MPKRLQGCADADQAFSSGVAGFDKFRIGEPDLPTPDFLRREATRRDRRQNGYVASGAAGTSRKDSRACIVLAWARIVVTCGSQEAMTAAFLSIVDIGDDVCSADPSFPAYDACVRISQAIGLLPLAGGDRLLRHRKFKRAITPKTKAAVVISPSNPTGKIFTETDLRQIAEVVEGTGIYLISDEIYSDLYFGERPHSASEFYERTVIVSGLSKSLSMTGWRLGWAASSRPEVMHGIQVLHGFLTVCASAITQKASLLGWSAEAEEFKAHAREVYKKRGDFLVDLFDKELGLKATAPEGAFYTMLDVRSVGDDIEIAEECLQNRVITVPGVAFGSEAKGFLRISFCNSEERMAEGVRRMKEAING